MLRFSAVSCWLTVDQVCSKHSDCCRNKLGSLLTSVRWLWWIVESISANAATYLLTIHWVHLCSLCVRKCMCVIMYHALVAVRAVVTTRWQCYHLEKGHFYHYGLQSSLRVKMIMFLTKINNICKHNIKCLQVQVLLTHISNFCSLSPSFPFLLLTLLLIKWPKNIMTNDMNKPDKFPLPVLWIIIAHACLLRFCQNYLTLKQT